MKYADCPTAVATLTVEAGAADVWRLVSDITLPARFSTEVAAVEWTDGFDGPVLGARFVGHNAHEAIGEWQTTCYVSGLEPERVFEWTVLGVDGDASAIWRYTITDGGDGSVELEHWFQMGPGRSGLNFAIDRMPDKEDRIVAHRLHEHQENMGRMLAGIKAAAEEAARGTHP